MNKVVEGYVPDNLNKENAINSTPIDCEVFIKCRRKISESQDFKDGGSGVFCCILLIIATKFFLFATIVLWRFFDIDVLFYKSHYSYGQSNFARFNITKYNDYFHKHHRPDDLMG